MKYFVFFFLCLVAMTSAAPQFLGAWPGLVAPLGSRTIVAGPTVVNGFDGLGYGLGGRIVSPGVIGVI